MGVSLFELTYGESDRVRIDLPSEAVVDWSRPAVEPVSDLVSAVEAALAVPLSYPPLSEATVPGDQIVLAVDTAAPGAAAAVWGIVKSLLAGRAQVEDLTILVPDHSPESLAITHLIPEPLRGQIRVETHRPEYAAGLAYLAGSNDGKPIYFNRRIDEADVVIPVGQLRLDSAWGYPGVHGCLYPLFSDSASQERFRRSLADWPQHQRARTEEAEEAAWLLGVQFTVQLAPGPSGSLLHVLAGEAKAVATEGRRRCEAAWLIRPRERATLVVAAIEGGPHEQTWENFSRALDAAANAVAEGGAIVLCTRLRSLEDESPAAGEGPSSRRRVSKLLRQTREQAQVFLLSDLDGDAVEDMGLGHVSAPEEITRLSRRFSSCLLLGHAQHVRVVAPDANQA